MDYDDLNTYSMYLKYQKEKLMYVNSKEVVPFFTLFPTNIPFKTDMTKYLKIIANFGLDITNQITEALSL